MKVRNLCDCLLNLFYPETDRKTANFLKMVRNHEFKKTKKTPKLQNLNFRLFRKKTKKDITIKP